MMTTAASHPSHVLRAISLAIVRNGPAGVVGRVKKIASAIPSDSKFTNLPLLGIAYPVRRPVPILTVLRDSVVSPGRSHASTALMLKSGLAEGQSLLTEAAAASLAQEHGLYAAFVLAPTGGRILADFPSIRVSSDRSIQDGLVVLGELRLHSDFRDGAAAIHLGMCTGQLRESTQVQRSISSTVVCGDKQNVQAR
jgi:hypothetical protein